MKREIFITADGSHSFRLEQWDEAFHSSNGAVQESQYTYLDAGFHFLMGQFPREQVRVFEMGFGTGLNPYLLSRQYHQHEIEISYTGIEAFPLSEKEYQDLNYAAQDEISDQELFRKLHSGSWGEFIELKKGFNFRKLACDLHSWEPDMAFDLVLFDAFAPAFQPELWTYEIFKKLFDSMTLGSVLVTYSAAGAPRRAMQKAGFWIEELPGALGKREMTRAIKW